MDGEKKLNESNLLNELDLRFKSQNAYYTEILRSTSDQLVKWALILNTGCVAVTAALLGAKQGSGKVWELLIPILIYCFGIVLILFATIFEKSAF